MEKKYTVLLILIVLFIFGKPASAYFEAGSSARLSDSIYQQEQYNDYQDYMAKKTAIVSVLKAYNSPLVSEADAFMKACKQYKLDCYLLPSITGLESSFGKYYAPHTYNPFGWGGGYIPFESWEHGIMTVGKGLRENYINQGLLTTEQIGAKYAESPTWSVRVNSIARRFIDEEEKNTHNISLLLLE